VLTQFHNFGIYPEFVHLQLETQSMEWPGNPNSPVCGFVGTQGTNSREEVQATPGGLDVFFIQSSQLSCDAPAKRFI